MIKNSTQLNYQIWNNYLINSIISTPEGKADFERKLRDLLKVIKDKNIKKHYGIFFKKFITKLFYSDNGFSIPNNKKKILMQLINLK